MGINISYLFNHTKEHLRLIKAISGSLGMDVIKNYFAHVYTVKIVEYRKSELVENLTDLKVLVYKAEALGIIRMLFAWLEDDAPTPIDEIIAYAKSILSHQND